ncbi:uncharacterized protein LOC105168696 [Sesamum indicum]|uniref:Uncharacterized protein LOC105168696 n=1 Tax=Sesamum indicum TaxID=4182 RepID=A0A6I9TNE3_SESIN|nr:uncharacterized protein LOC105168696 [Sesamum indicum]
MAFLFVESLAQNKSRVVQTAIKALELVLLSAGLVSTLLMLKGAVQTYSCQLVLSNLVGFWNSIRCFLSSPLYICIIINSMVALIAASSTLHPQQEIDIHDYDDVKVSLDDDDNIPIPQPPAEADAEPATLEKGMSLEMEVSSNDQGQDEADDTIEATWKAITGGGKQRPERKHLKKSETWNVRTPPHRQSAAAVESLKFSEELLKPTTARKELRKSETFADSVMSITRRGGLRRDPSVGLDEFNKQVEAFIKKFNNEMRLQRQESEQRFLDMLKRGV